MLLHTGAAGATRSLRRAAASKRFTTAHREHSPRPASHSAREGSSISYTLRRPRLNAPGRAESETIARAAGGRATAALKDIQAREDLRCAPDACLNPQGHLSPALLKPLRRPRS